MTPFCSIIMKIRFQLFPYKLFDFKEILLKFSHCKIWIIMALILQVFVDDQMA